MKARVNGVDMSYRVEGSGPAVLLLHAFPLSGEMWEPQAAALQSRARLIVPDLRGFGGTDAQPPAPSLEEIALDVIGLLKHLGVESFILGGLSMGGYLSFALLRQIDRNRVKGLVLADTRAGADNEEGRRNREQMAIRAEQLGSGPIAEEMVERLLGPTSLNSRPELIERVKAIIRANPPDGIAAAQRAMASRTDSEPMLPDLTMPTLVLVGEEDALTPPAEAERMASAIPDARCAVIPRAGHLSNLEQPELFNHLLSGFLDQLAQ